MSFKGFNNKKNYNIWERKLIKIQDSLKLDKESGKNIIIYNQLCGSDDNSIHVWDTMKTNHNGTLNSHDNRVTSISLAPNGMALVSSSWDQFVGDTT
jgi:WD40 repeat protein